MSAAIEVQGSEDPDRRVPIISIVKKLGKEFLDDDVPGLAAEVAYHTIFAIPAVIILFVFLAAILENLTSIAVATQLQELVNERAPGDLQEVLTSVIDNAIEQMSGGIASIGAIAAAAVAIWSGSNGTAAFMKAFNRAYDLEEDRPFAKKKGVAIGLTLLLGGFVNLAIVMLVFGGRIGHWSAENFGFGSAFELVVSVVRWPLGIALIMTMLAVLYYLGPNVNQSFRWASPGSILATTLWAGVVLGFSLLLTVMSPGSAYGTLSSLVVFLFFLYITAIILLIGAELNAILEKRFDPETLEDIAEHPEKFEDEVFDDPLVPAASGTHDREQSPHQQVQPDPHDVSWGSVAKGTIAAAALLVVGRAIK